MWFVEILLSEINHCALISSNSTFCWKPSWCRSLFATVFSFPVLFPSTNRDIPRQKPVVILQLTEFCGERLSEFLVSNCMPLKQLFKSPSILCECGQRMTLPSSQLMNKSSVFPFSELPAIPVQCRSPRQDDTVKQQQLHYCKVLSAPHHSSTKT